jgi:nucleotidyltransferase substrate binding protein (TIGR01987 family)
MKATHNFRKTLEELESFLEIPIQNDRDIAGIIQAFEFTYEQCWKSIQKVATTQGITVASPKNAFSFALKSTWIPATDETKWIQLIEDRNRTSHTYQEELAHEVLERVQKEYVQMFRGLLLCLENAIETS